VNQPELAHPARRRRARHAGASAPEDFTPAVVTVAWTPSSHDGERQRGPIQVELVAGLDAALTGASLCPQGVGPNWLEALFSAHCSEVVLTARLGDDLAAKHRVLELAELLTLKLTATHPLIRVLFLPAKGDT